jgi:hypothetical protein
VVPDDGWFIPGGGFEFAPVDGGEPLGVAGETAPVEPLDFSVGEFPSVALEFIPLPVSLALFVPGDELDGDAVPAPLVD